MSKVARKRGKNNAVHRISRSMIMFFFDCASGVLVTGSIWLGVVVGSRLTSSGNLSVGLLSPGSCGAVDIFQHTRPGSRRRPSTGLGRAERSGPRHYYILHRIQYCNSVWIADIDLSQGLIGSTARWWRTLITPRTFLKATMKSLVFTKSDHPFQTKRTYSPLPSQNTVSIPKTSRAIHK